MSFVFALAQLFTITFAPVQTVPELDDRPVRIEATPSKGDLLQQPMMERCAGNRCRHISMRPGGGAR